MKKRIKNILLRFIKFLLALLEEEKINKQYSRSDLVLGKNTRIKVKYSFYKGNISIGKNTYINDYARIVTGENSKVSIGENCAIGRFLNCSSITHSLKRPTATKDHNTHLKTEADIYIGNCVWIGEGVMIKSGVSIDNYAVIGANSVVTSDVKAFEIVAGCPAKHIKYNDEHYLFKKTIQ